MDRSVKNDKRYVYRIVGVNEHGESGQSRSAKADTYLVAITPFPGLDDTSAEGLTPARSPRRKSTVVRWEVLCHASTARPPQQNDRCVFLNDFPQRLEEESGMS